MRKKILVLQFRTDKSLTHEQNCLIAGGKFKQSELCFLNILEVKSNINIS